MPKARSSTRGTISPPRSRLPNGGSSGSRRWTRSRCRSAEAHGVDSGPRQTSSSRRGPMLTLPGIGLRRNFMAAQVIHVEVTGSDGEGLQSFYRDVFGSNLDTNNPGGYRIYRQDN